MACRELCRRTASGCRRLVLLGTMVLALSGMVGIPAAGAGAADDRGFWLGLSPLAGAYQLSYGYDAPGTGERIEHTEWLHAWALELGIPHHLRSRPTFVS